MLNNVGFVWVCVCLCVRFHLCLRVFVWICVCLCAFVVFPLPSSQDSRAPEQWLWPRRGSLDWSGPAEGEAGRGLYCRRPRYAGSHGTDPQIQPLMAGNDVVYPNGRWPCDCICLPHSSWPACTTLSKMRRMWPALTSTRLMCCSTTSESNPKSWTFWAENDERKTCQSFYQLWELRKSLLNEQKEKINA